MTIIRRDGHPVFIVPSAEYMHRLTDKLMRRERFPMWVVYDPHTIEYPGQWVARMHVAMPQPKPTRFVITHDSLADLRNLLPPWMVRCRREPDDAPEIIEVWL